MGGFGSPRSRCNRNFIATAANVAVGVYRGATERFRAEDGIKAVDEIVT